MAKFKVKSTGLILEVKNEAIITQYEKKKDLYEAVKAKKEADKANKKDGKAKKEADTK